MNGWIAYSIYLFRCLTYSLDSNGGLISVLLLRCSLSLSIRYAYYIYAVPEPKICNGKQQNKVCDQRGLMLHRLQVVGSDGGGKSDSTETSKKV